MEIWRRTKMKIRKSKYHQNSAKGAHCGALIWRKFPINCDAHLAKSIFRTLIHKLLTDIQMEEQQYVETSYNLICLLAVCDYKR